MRKSLLQMYHDLKEAGSTDDFPLLLGNVAHKQLMKSFRTPISPWRQYSKRGELSDFKTHDRIVLAEAPDLLPVEEGGAYQAGNYPKDDRYQIQGDTVGRSWTLTRKAIINDDLNGFLTWTDKYGRAANRTLAKQVTFVLEGNAVGYDGTAIFTAAHANTVAGDITADDAGVTKLSSAWQKMMDATDPRSGEKIGVTPWAVLCAPTKAVICQRLLGIGELRPISTSGGPVFNPFGPGSAMYLPGGVIVEPFLTRFPNRIYLIANPADMHFAEVGFLQGMEEPTLLMKKPESVRVMGGAEDPWGFEFDDMNWKIRHDWGIAAAYHQAVVGIGGGLT